MPTLISPENLALDEALCVIEGKSIRNSIPFPDPSGWRGRERERDREALKVIIFNDTITR